MASVLTEFFPLEEIVKKINKDMSGDDEDEEDYIENVSIWLKDKDLFKPAIEFAEVKKLPPGLYNMGISRDGEYFCKNLILSSDELFIFSENSCNRLIEEIQKFWDSKPLYDANKLLHKRGILLEGYAGTGKSSLITILSLELIKRGGVVFKVNDVRNFYDYIGFIKNYFRKIEPETPIITIIEDLDKYEEVELDMLDFFDGKNNINNHVIICTSNNLEDIPDTFLRPSRIDYRLEVPLPNEIIRKEYFEFKNVPSEQIPQLVELSEGCSLADLKELYISVFILGYSVTESISKIKEPKQKINYLSNNLHKAKFGI